MDSKRIRCPECGTGIGEEFARCPVCHRVSPGRVAPETIPGDTRSIRFPNAMFVPWYRREPRGLTSVLVILFSPLTVALCVLCLTGNIYTRVKDREGNLKVWGVGNKVAAVVLLPIQGLVWWAAWRMSHPR